MFCGPLVGNVLVVVALMLMRPKVASDRIGRTVAVVNGVVVVDVIRGHDDVKVGVDVSVDGNSLVSDDSVDDDNVYDVVGDDV